MSPEDDPILIGPLTPSDYESYHETLILGLEAAAPNDKIYRSTYLAHLRPTMETAVARRSALRRFAPSPPPGHLHLKAYRASDPQTVLGYAYWFFENLEDDKHDDPAVLIVGDEAAFVALQAAEHETMDLDFLARRKAMHREVERRLMGPAGENEGREYMHLSSLVTHPDHARQGIASALVSYGLDLADEQGLACYLTSSVSGFPIYLRAGFKVVETLSIVCYPNGRHGEPETIEYPALIRLARSK